MKTTVKNMLLAAIAAAGCTAPAMAQDVRIAEVYGGGGNTGAPYNADFIVLFNRGATPAVLTNWSVQYAATAGTSWSIVGGPINATIPAGGYYLVRGATGANGAALPTPDLVGTVNLSGSNGKVALMNIGTAITAGVSCPVGDPTFGVSTVDFLGFGTANCSETAASAAGSNTTSLIRAGNGCVDTNNNSTDFTAAAPTPRNSASPAGSCGSGGACCTGVSTCAIVANVGACTGTYVGDGSTCTPNPCLPPTGSCCVATSTTCTVNTQADCTTLGGTWTNGGTCTTNICQGSCCVPANTTCTITSPSDCTAQSGTWVSAGTCTPTNPCLGACCVGTTCTQTSAVGCVGGYWVAAGVCAPGYCPSEVAVQVGDVAYGANVTANLDAGPQVRDVSGAGTRVGTWSRFNFLQSMEFDNSGGGNHNPQGNLLALNFGSSAVTGGILHNLSTNGSAAGETLFSFNGTQFGLQASRVGGLSVSPDNSKLAMVGTDSARVIVLNYSAGASVGTGSGASITGGNQSDNITFLFATAQTSGTAWLNNSELITYVNSSDLFTFVGPAIFTIPVSGSGTLGTPVFRLGPTTTALGATSRFYGLAYNPAISPYIYAVSSSFVATPAPGVSTSLLSVIDPTTWTEVKLVNLSTSVETIREVAIGDDRNLYIGQFAGSTFQVGVSALIDRLNLDVDNSGAITLADTNALTDNSSTNWYLRVETPTIQPTSSFNGLDIAVSAGTPTTGACCLINGSCSVTTSGACIGGTFQGLGSSCTPNPCPQPSNGRCCIGARCAIVAQASCTASGAAGVVFTAGQTNCNATGTFNTPCCFADYNKVGGVGVQDIFDFLGDWFSGSVNANVQGDGIAAPGVQDIFDFLSGWFSGC